jgi:hypothetical protein
MKTQGMKVLDPVLENGQIDWLVVSAQECPNQEAERRLAQVHFRVPHEPWGAERAFVTPVRVRRSRRRVLFVQKSGLLLKQGESEI